MDYDYDRIEREDTMRCSVNRLLELKDRLDELNMDCEESDEYSIYLDEEELSTANPFEITNIYDIYRAIDVEIENLNGILKVFDKVIIVKNNYDKAIRSIVRMISDSSIFANRIA